MLAAINPKIVAELDALAASWAAVATEIISAPTAKPRRLRARKRKSSSKP